LTPLEALVARHRTDAGGLLVALRRHGVPPAAVADLTSELDHDESWREAVAADRARGERMERAVAAVEAALAPLAGGVEVLRSPLGAAWGRDVDVVVSHGRLEDAEAALRTRGWPSLDPLLTAIGRGDARCRRYAVIEGGEALASVELRTGATPDRLRRLGAKGAAARRPTVRAALELAALAEERGAREVRRAAPLALRRCARLERELGASGPMTELARGLPPRPNLAWPRARLTHLPLRASRLRAERLVVSFSGIDGSGKSTQAALLRESLDRLGVPAAAVWGRVGFSSSRLLSGVTDAIRRFLPSGSHSAQRARAEGSGGGEQPLTRRGPVGWSWALAVTVEYLRQVRAGVRRRRGHVVVLDRGLPDALVDLEQGFGGSLGLGLHRRLVRRFTPRADVMFYLRISGAAAVARKDDFFAASVLQGYADRLDALAPPLGAVVVDAEQPLAELAHEILRAVIVSP
jgi:thymidylate kinase